MLVNNIYIRFNRLEFELTKLLLISGAKNDNADKTKNAKKKEICACGH